MEVKSDLFVKKCPNKIHIIASHLQRQAQNIDEKSQKDGDASDSLPICKILCNIHNILHISPNIARISPGEFA